MKKVTGLIIFIFALLPIGSAVFIIVKNRVQLPATEKKVEIIHHSTMQGIEFFDEAYLKKPELPELPSDTRGVVVPHHLLPAPITAGFFDGVKTSPTRIIVIGPDHLSHALANLVTSRATWKTPYGDILPDGAVIDSLVASNVLKIDEPIFDEEFSVSGLTPFIKRSFPKAKIVPILVQTNTSSSTLEKLAQVLPTLDSKTLLIASVDFSHGQPDWVAELHDQKSRAILSSFAYEDLKDIEVDSPETLNVFLQTLENNGVQKMSLIANTNSALVTKQKDSPEVTSYLYAAFQPGEISPDKTVTTLVFGDMMFDRSVRKLTDVNGLDYVFDKIRGYEDRFFRGLDLIVGNLEGAISLPRAPNKEIDFDFDDEVATLLSMFNFDAVSLANNHALDQGRAGFESTQKVLSEAGIGFFGSQTKDDVPAWTTEVRGQKIVWLGFNITDHELNKKIVEEKIREARAQNNFVIVMMHWGAEYKPRPAESIKNLGRELVDFGADVVIGGHPHVMQGMEVWKGHPIFWSLGNFVFDQYWSEETERALSVGLALNGKSVKIYFYPLISENSQPRIAMGEERRKMLEEFAKRSDLSDILLKEAQNGIMDLQFE